MNKVFENICKMSQKALKSHVARELTKTHSKVYVGDGYVYAQGEFPVLLVAHMDTVHKKLPNKIIYDSTKDAYSSPNGIGGDDRCGVYMILEIVKEHNCSVLFCEDEETGGIGAKKFIKTDLAKELKFNYAIELDRKGNKDAVFYDCDNTDFEDFITKEFYETAYGSFSDISVLAPFLGCAAVNLSCGYYAAHTEKEYVVLSEMETSIDAVCAILKRTTEEDKFEYIEAKVSSWFRYGYNSNGNGRSYYSGYYSSYEDDDYLDTYYYIIEYVNEFGQTSWFDTYATSEAEAIGKLLMWHPTLCYGSVMDVMVDKTY